MNRREKMYGDAYPKSLAAALRRASSVDIIAPSRIIIEFNNSDNADAAYDWLVHIKAFESKR